MASEIAIKFASLKLIGFSNSTCYDDYNCDTEKHAAMLHRTFAAFCFLLCFIGMIINPIIIPAYNLLNNRSGFTLYLTIVSILDTLYLLLIMITFVVRYMPQEYNEQMVMYATFTAHLVPFAIPLISFCEILVVWLIFAILVDRLLFLKLGFQSKTMQTRSVSVKVSLCLIIGAFIFMVPKCFEYRTDTFPNLALSKVVYKDIGKNYYYRNLLNHWLKVPLEMFFPYLGIAVFIAMLISKMLIEKAKYRKLWILSNASICCPWIFNSFTKKNRDKSAPSEANTSLKLLPSNPGNCDIARFSLDGRLFIEYILSNVPLDQMARGGDGSVCDQCQTNSVEVSDISVACSLENISLKNKPSCQHNITFDQMLMAHNQNREKTNVLIAVTLGLLLICLKLPKFFLHVLEAENYSVYDNTSFKATNYLLDVIYAMAKPFVCFALGGHFRWAIVGACCKNARSYNYGSDEHLKNLFVISKI